MNVDVLIVGAGMAGLTAARELQQAGLTPLVLDKGRAVGGRMATRRIGDATFDHGAQHFSVRSPEFEILNRTLHAAGVTRTWYRGRSRSDPARGVEDRQVGNDGMRRIPEFLSAGVPVQTSVEVTRIEPRGEGSGPSRVTAWVGTERAPSARSLILTPPVPQSLALLDRSGIDLSGARDLLTSIEYDPVLAVLATLDRSPQWVDGHLALSRGPIAWIGDNASKGTSRVPAITLHSTAAFAEEWFDEPTDSWVECLMSAAVPHLSGAAVLSAVGHRWRYAQPRQELQIGALLLRTDPPIVVAGEVFAGAKVEGAFQSGRAAARIILEAVGGGGVS